MKNKNLLGLISFVALAILAVLIVVDNLLPLIGVTVGGVLFNVLDTVKDVLVLIVLGMSSYAFVKDKSKNVNIAYWVFVGLFVVGTLLSWF